MLDLVGYVNLGISATWFFLKPPLLGIEKGSPCPSLFLKFLIFYLFYLGLPISNLGLNTKSCGYM